MSNALMNILRAVSTKSTIPALEGVLIQAYDGELVLTGYDMEIAMITEIEATVEEKGEVVVSARLLADIVRKMPEEIVEISTDERLITYIKSGSADHQIVGISSMEYPELPNFDSEDELIIQAGLLRDMIRQTIYAVSDIKEVPVYTGSLYEMTENQLRIVALDGFRMAIRTEQVKCEKVPPFIVPAKTQAEMMRLITDEEEDIKLNIGKRHISYVIGKYTIVSRLIEGLFIDYNSTIPTEASTEFVIKTRKLLDAVERVSLITTDKIKTPIRWRISNDTLTLLCNTNIGKAKDYIEVEYIGEDVSIAFNHRFLIDALKNADSDEVKIKISGSLKPMIMTPVKGDSFLFVVVPMRVSDDLT